NCKEVGAHRSPLAFMDHGRKAEFGLNLRFQIIVGETIEVLVAEYALVNKRPRPPSAIIGIICRRLNVNAWLLMLPSSNAMKSCAILAEDYTAVHVNVTTTPRQT